MTNIDSHAFANCRNIKELYYDANIYSEVGIVPKKLFIGDHINIVFPVKYKYNIYDSYYPYGERDYLETVVLGKNVTHIRTDALRSKNLREVYVTGEEPPFCYPNALYDDLSKAILYIPKNQMEYYKTTEPWNEFGKILPLEGNEPASIDNLCNASSEVHVVNGLIQIHSAPFNSTVSVYTTKGQLLETHKADNSPITLDLPRNTIYIIKVDNKVFKIKN